MPSCEDFQSIQECANDTGFCQTYCELVTCSPTLTMTVSKHTSDKQVLSRCLSLTDSTSLMITRYNLQSDQKEAMPALISFILTILTCLLVLFILIVIHYNCAISLRDRVPYNIACLGCCRAPEAYFPYCINEEMMRRHLIEL